MMQPGVSVVIRCFNEEDHLGKLLAGILQQTLVPKQIVVVDSGSTDATLAIASRFPVEIHHVAPEEFSFGRSLNIGCRAARGDIIVIASAHVYPLFDSWLQKLTAPFDDPRVALTYGRQVGDETTIFSEHQILRRWFPAKSDLDQSHPFCNNANAAIRRSVWEDLPYDESLTGLEDMAWAQAVLSRGDRVAYVAEAPIAHVHHETWGQLVNRYRREAIAHRRIMHDQHMGRMEALRLAVANILSDYVHALRQGQLLHNLGAIPWFRSAQFLGTYRGFAQRGEVSAIVRRRFYYPLELRHRPLLTDVANGEDRPIDYDEATPAELPERPT